jgi:hypothetical protein
MLPATHSRHPGAIFLIQPFLRGPSLADKLYQAATASASGLQNPLSTYSSQEGLNWLVDIAQGLEHLHSTGPGKKKIIHRYFCLTRLFRVCRRPCYPSQGLGGIIDGTSGRSAPKILCSPHACVVLREPLHLHLWYRGELSLPSSSKCLGIHDVWTNGAPFIIGPHGCNLPVILLCLDAEHSCPCIIYAGMYLSAPSLLVDVRDILQSLLARGQEASPSLPVDRPVFLCRLGLSTLHQYANVLALISKHLSGCPCCHLQCMQMVCLPAE